MIWGFAAAMLVVAIVIVLFPLWRPSANSALDSNTANVEVLKDQLQELEVELAAGNISQEDFDTAKYDLESAVAADIADDEPFVGKLGKGNRNLTTLFLLILIPVGSVVFYLQVTTYRELPPRNEMVQQAMEQAAGEQLPPIDQMVEVLAAKLRENPDNAEGWQMLGRSYMILERYDAAAGAYAKANELTGESDPEMLLDYAEVLAFANQNQMTGKPIELVNKALKIAPNLPKALWLRGFGAFQAGEYSKAINSWNQVVNNPAVGQETRDMLLVYISEAEVAIGGEVSSAQAAPTAGTTNDAETIASLKVSVSLDEAFIEKAKPDETVFVFARAVSGPPMPLAVQKLTVADLPVEVVLDDNMAMIPGMNISSQPEVVVGARISRAGTPMPQPGDLQGLSDALQPGTHSAVSIVINQLVE